MAHGKNKTGNKPMEGDLKSYRASFYDKDIKKPGIDFMDKQAKVYEKLKELNISYEVKHHQAAYTIEEMDNLGILDDDIVKNLFLRDDKGREHFLVVLPQDKKADLRSIRSQIGCRHLCFASEKRLEKYLNLTKGSVSPLGIINDSEGAVKVVIDRELTGKKRIGVHPNDNTATVYLSFDDLLHIIEANCNEILFVDI
jgi:Ala-tRNA(Pro) deacylase